MFNPGELEGEVDHTFFDSDCEEGSRAINNGILMAHDDKIHSESTNNFKGILEHGEDTKKSPKSVDNNDSSHICGKSDNISSQILTSDSENEERIYSKQFNKHFLNLLAEAKEDDEDDSEECGKYASSKTENLWTKKKPIGRCHSSLSSDASRDTDSDSCHSNDSYNPKHNKTSSSGSRESIVDLSTFGHADCGSPEESDYTVTDVSPLSSPASSRLQSLDLNHSETEDDDVKEQQQSAPSSGFSHVHQEGSFSLEDTDEYSLSSRSRQEGKAVMQFPASRLRKNYSFTNDEVQRIDRENQRLLQQLSSSSRPGSASGQKHRVTSNTPLKRLPHSALNRQREQQRIERENLAFLKRLESVKPSPGMKRSEQLANYQRQVGYLGIGSFHHSTSQVSLGGKGLNQNKATHRSASAASAATALSSKPVSRSRKTKAAPPAWS